jgi:hypothetical protein
MRTPAGKECKYFYGNYYRGRNSEECRLLGDAWERVLCSRCSIPEILRSNACESMRLSAVIDRPLGALFRKQVKVTTYCEKTGRSGFDPYTGCGECHPVPLVFRLEE